VPAEVSIDGRQSFGTDRAADVGLRLEAEGSTDEAGRGNIELLLEKRTEIPDSSVISPNDTYRFRYWQEDLELLAGDDVFSLSDLTETSRYGRGAAVDALFDGFGAGAYYHQSYWLDKPEHTIAGYVDYRVLQSEGEPNLYLARLGGLGVVDQSAILSLYQHYAPLPEVTVEAEGAVDHEGELAVLGRTRGASGPLSYSAEAIWGHPDYQGRYNDMLILRSNLGFVIAKDVLVLTTRVEREARNLQLKESLPDAPIRWGFYMGTDFLAPSTRTDLALLWRLGLREDQLTDPDYDERSNDWWLRIRQPLGRISLGAALAVSLATEHEDSRRTVGQDHALTVDYRHSQSAAYSGGLRYSGTIDDGAATNHRLGWEVGSALSRGPLELSSGLQNGYRFDSRGYAETDFQLTVNADYALDRKNRLAGGALINTRLRPDGSATWGRISLEYAHALEIPVSRKRDTGGVKGVVVQQDTGEPLSGAIVRMGGRAVVSDRRGRFTFGELSPGTQYIDVTSGFAGRNLVPIGKTPIPVEVQPGADTHVTVHMGVLGRLEGEVILYRFAVEAEGFAPPAENSSKSEKTGEQDGTDTAASLVFGGPYGGLLVEVSNGAETHRRLTAADGRFVFEQLGPGQWTVRFGPHGLPEYHVVEPAVLHVEVAPGETQTAAIRIVPMKREIQMIDTGSLTPD
jgi:hypothetical protein